MNVTFKGPIQQIVFPVSARYEDLCGKFLLCALLTVDFFAVRTLTEVAILKCSRTEDKRAFVEYSMTLPLPPMGHAKSKYIADTTFSPSGSQIATVTDQGFWTVYDLNIRAETASLVASGWLDLPELSVGEMRTGWWKIEWDDQTNNLLVAESKGLHFLNLNVSLRNSTQLTRDWFIGRGDEPQEQRTFQGTCSR